MFNESLFILLLYSIRDRAMIDEIKQNNQLGLVLLIIFRKLMVDVN